MTYKFIQKMIFMSFCPKSFMSLCLLKYVFMSTNLSVFFVLIICLYVPNLYVFLSYKKTNWANLVSKMGEITDQFRPFCITIGHVLYRHRYAPSILSLSYHAQKRGKAPVPVVPNT